MRLRLFAAAVVASLALLAVGGEAPAATSAPTIDWTVATPGTSPPYLAYAAGAYDAFNSTFVMFGGVGANGAVSGTTWVWNGSNWSRPQYSGGPPARELASMAFDPKLQKFILFGGQNANGLLSDTWAWNGQSWTELSTSGGVAGGGTAPSPRAGAALAYDPAGFLVLFGGTGYANPATSPTTGGTSASPTQVPPAEVTLADTWQWEGLQLGWVQAHVTGPPARSGATESYDAANHTTVLFGGESAVTTSGQPKLLGDTWIWNGRSWARATPAVSPPARLAAVSDDDTAAGGPLLVGGQGQSGPLSDSWIWAGGTWTAAKSEGENPAREAAAGAYLATSGQFLVFGGGNGAQTIFDMTTLGTVVPNRTSPGGSPPTTTAPSRATTTKPGSTTSGKATTTTLKKTSTTTLGRHLTSPTSQAPKSQTAWITTSQTKLQRGSAVHVNGAGFEAGTIVTLTFHSSPSNLGTAHTGPGGGFQLDVAVPRNASSGPHTIEATGVEADGQIVEVSATVYVSAPSNTSTATKAFLIGLAILVPVTTYLAMMLNSALRSRRNPVTSPGTAPRSPS